MDLLSLNGLPEVLAAKERLSLANTVSFEIDATDDIRSAVFEHGISLGSKVPMRWIRGDTLEHVDQSSHFFQKTFLAYVNDCSGDFILGGETHSIHRNKAFLFDEGVKHYTEGASDRLVLGPMSEDGFQVGAIPFESVTSYTTRFDVYFYKENATSNYSCSAEIADGGPQSDLTSALQDGNNFFCSITGLQPSTLYNIDVTEDNGNTAFNGQASTLVGNPLSSVTSYKTRLDVFFSSDASRNYSCTAAMLPDYGVSVYGPNLAEETSPNQYFCSFTGIIPETSYSIIASSDVDEFTGFAATSPIGTFSSITSFTNRFDVYFVDEEPPANYSCTAYEQYFSVQNPRFFAAVRNGNNVLCSITGLSLSTAYNVSVFDEFYTQLFRGEATTTCFAGAPTIPTLLSSNTYVSSWSSDVTGIDALLYGFQRFDENGDPIDLLFAQSLSNAIYTSFSDLKSFSIAAFASNSCGFTKSDNYIYSFKKTFSTISYIYSNSIGFSYSVDVSGVSNVGTDNMVNFVYSNGDGIDNPNLPVVNNSITGFINYSDFDDVSYSLTNILAYVLSWRGYPGQTFAVSDFFTPVDPPSDSPPSSSSSSTSAARIAIISILAVFLTLILLVTLYQSTFYKTLGYGYN